MYRFRDADLRIRELEGSIAHRKSLAASLVRNGFMGAAAEVLILVDTLQTRLEARRRDAGMQSTLAAR